MNPALRQITLPQNNNSMEAMERFLDAVHNNNTPMIRTEYIQGTKKTLTCELQRDCLYYFVENKHLLSDEFIREATNRINAHKVDNFCQVIREHWFDGAAKRASEPVLRIKQSIRNYLVELTGSIELADQCVMKPVADDINPLFDNKELAMLLTINDELLRRHLYEWSKLHPTLRTASRDEIYYRRGFMLETLLPNTSPYTPVDYISSYSLALSIPEQFASMRSHPKNLPALVCAPCDYFNGRVLFFSPFIPEMAIHQLELGIIPNEKPETLEYQGEHSGMHEYIFI